MNNHADLFYPERVDEQVEHLARLQDQQQQASTPGAPTIAALQSIYKEDEAILANAWSRLAKLEAATQPSGNTNQQIVKDGRRGESIMHKTEFAPETDGSIMPFFPTTVRPQRPRLRRWRAASLIAATLTAAVIASTMIWIINAGQHKTPTPGSPAKTPAATAPFAVYVGSEDGLERVDARTGKIVWQYHFPVSTTPYVQIFFSQILPAGRTVYGLAGISGTLTQVMAFDAKTGRVLWSYNAPQATNMVLEHNTLYLGINDADPNTHKSYISALDARKGTPLATKYTLDGYAPNLSLADGVLYAVTDTHLAAIDIVHSQRIWQKSAAELIPGPNYVSIEGFSATHEAVYATFQTVSGVYCVALKASNGSKLWQTDPFAVKGASGGGAGISAPVASDTTVYFAAFGYSSTVLAYDARKGTRVWQSKTTALLQRTPVLSGNTLYIAEDIISTGSPKTRFAALNGTTGKLIWQTGEKQGVGLLGFAFNGVVYVAATYAKTTNITYALSSYTGTVIWQASLDHNPTALAGGKIS